MINYIRFLPSKLSRRCRVRNLLFILSSIFTLSTFAEVSSAQSYLVKPMRVEVSAQPAAKFYSSVQVRNTGSETGKIKLKLGNLTQSPSGAWQGLSPGALSPVSCLPWIYLEAETLDLAAMATGEARIHFAPPPSARGFYFASLWILPERGPDADLNVAFLIPIVVEISGRLSGRTSKSHRWVWTSSPLKEACPAPPWSPWTSPMRD